MLGMGKSEMMDDSREMGLMSKKKRRLSRLGAARFLHVQAARVAEKGEP